MRPQATANGKPHDTVWEAAILIAVYTLNARMRLLISYEMYSVPVDIWWGISMSEGSLIFARKKPFFPM